MKEEINTMPKTSLYNMEGAAIGEVELSEELFAAPINTAAMHLVVRSILANQRQGTQSALTRASGNIEKLQTSYVNTLTVYDILKAGKIILTKDALKGVEEVYA